MKQVLKRKPQESANARSTESACKLNLLISPHLSERQTNFLGSPSKGRGVAISVRPCCSPPRAPARAWRCSARPWPGSAAKAWRPEPRRRWSTEPLGSLPQSDPWGPMGTHGGKCTRDLSSWTAEFGLSSKVRTHAQIKQIVGELRKSGYRRMLCHRPQFSRPNKSWDLAWTPT